MIKKLTLNTITGKFCAAALSLCVAQPCAAAGLSPAFDRQNEAEDARAQLRSSPTYVVRLNTGSLPAASAINLVDFERFIRELAKELEEAGATVTMAANSDAI